MITQYDQVKGDNHSKAKTIVEDLKKDQNSMFKHLMTLRTDNYPTETAYASVRPAQYASIVPMPADKLAFVYASKRYMIPFGWFSNPLPSTASTSCAVYAPLQL
jgi:hypothetical protein